jgi:hypothetical protein
MSHARAHAPTQALASAEASVMEKLGPNVARRSKSRSELSPTRVLPAISPDARLRGGGSPHPPLGEPLARPTPKRRISREAIEKYISTRDAAEGGGGSGRAIGGPSKLPRIAGERRRASVPTAAHSVDAQAHAGAHAHDEHEAARLRWKDLRMQARIIRGAAITIQAWYRGHQVRKELRRQHEAATTIQSARRG